MPFLLCNSFRITNCIELRSFCSLNHRSPFSNATRTHLSIITLVCCLHSCKILVIIAMKPFVASVRLRFSYRCQQPSNFQYHVRGCVYSNAVYFSQFRSTYTIFEIFNWVVFCFDSLNAINFVLNSHNQNSPDRIKERTHGAWTGTYLKGRKVTAKYHVRTIERPDIRVFEGRLAVS